MIPVTASLSPIVQPNMVATSPTMYVKMPMYMRENIKVSQPPHTSTGGTVANKTCKQKAARGMSKRAHTTKQAQRTGDPEDKSAGLGGFREPSRIWLESETRMFCC